MIQIKNSQKIWTIQIHETFAFENMKQLKTILETLLDIKQNYGQYHDLLKKHKNENRSY